jgi:hypothetical protein
MSVSGVDSLEVRVRLGRDNDDWVSRFVPIADVRSRKSHRQLPREGVAIPRGNQRYRLLDYLGLNDTHSRGQTYLAETGEDYPGKPQRWPQYARPEWRVARNEHEQDERDIGHGED